MKAIFFESHGEINVLKFGELPDPEPGPGEALVRVKAVALNHLDIWVRRGWPGLSLQMPHITGSDVVGEVVKINGDSLIQPSPTQPDLLQPGSKVVINPGIVTGEDEWVRRGEESVSPYYKILGEHRRGGLAEYVIVPLRNLFSFPATLSEEDAVAPLLVGLTSWRMLFHRGRLQPGESVLVVGSGGGVNSLSILLASTIGARVIALAGSAEKARRAVELGAETVINYNDHRNWAHEILKITKGRGVDLVIDNVGAATMGKSLRAVRRGGRIVTVGNTSGYDIPLDNRLVFTKQISLIGSTMGSTQDFIEAMPFIWRLPIHKIIDCVEPLANGIAMIQRIEQGEQIGKIVLKP